MKIWLDDIRQASSGFVHAHSVNEAKKLITNCELWGENIEFFILQVNAE